jgi:hypothetical protein
VFAARLDSRSLIARGLLLTLNAHWLPVPDFAHTHR